MSINTSGGGDIESGNFFAHKALTQQSLTQVPRLLRLSNIYLITVLVIQ